MIVDLDIYQLPCIDALLPVVCATTLAHHSRHGMSSNLTDNCSVYLRLHFSGNISNLHVPFHCVRYPTELEVFLIIVFLVLFIGTAGGNFLVITSVALVRKLQTPSNFLIVSLACSDFLVSILVLPGAVYQQINRNRWPFSELLCDIFISFDVILCTSSILNLCAISIDRYFVITRPLQYAVKRTPGRIGTMVAISWLSSALISIPPMIGWKETFVPGQCNYSENLIYQIYATFGAFYIPLLVMLVLYGRIFKLAREMAQVDTKMSVCASSHKVLDTAPDHHYDSGQMDVSMEVGSVTNVSVGNGVKHHRSRAHTETKAITTLGVIMGCFTICWLPFFIIQIVKSVLKVAHIDYMLYLPLWLIELCLWLGYVNSFLNPIIYVKFNREFRTPFKQILLFKCGSINARLRSETFVQEYGLCGASMKGSLTCTHGGAEQSSSNHTSQPGGRRRRVPTISRSHAPSDPCSLGSTCNHTRGPYSCAEAKGTDQALVTTQPITPANGVIATHPSLDEDHPCYNTNDQMILCCSMLDQRSDKYVYDFGPSSETESIDSPQPIDVSILDLTFV